MAANGSKEFASANSSLQTNANTAPSVSGDEVAAVTVPFSEKAGFNLDIDSREVSERIQPSTSMVPESVRIVTSSCLK